MLGETMIVIARHAARYEADTQERIREYVCKLAGRLDLASAWTEIQQNVFAPVSETYKQMIIRTYDHMTPAIDPRLIGQDSRSDDEEDVDKSLRNRGIDSNIDLGRPWSTMVDDGRPWSTMVDRGRSWSTMLDHGRPLVGDSSSMVDNGRPWSSFG